MKKFQMLLLSIVTCFALLTACGTDSNNQPTSTPKDVSNEAAGSGDSSNEAVNEEAVYENGLSKDEKVVLKVGLWESGSGRVWMDLAMERFTEKYPNVTFDLTSTPTLETILEPKIAAGNDEDMFDMFMPRFSSDATVSLARLLEADKLESQDDLWDRELPDGSGKTLRSVISDDYYTTAVSLGMTVRVPVVGYTSGLFFDQQLFDEKGWNKSPKTWDEFIALLDQIKADGIIPITFPGVYAGYLTDYVVNLWQFDLAKANGNFDTYLNNFRNYDGPQLTTDENKEAWSRLYEMGKSGYFPAGVAAINHTQSQMQVLQHKAAMVATGDWVGNEMKEATPEGFNWGFMSVPLTNEPNQTIFVNAGVGDVNFAIWKNKPELTKQWAKEFIMSLFNFEIQESLAADAGSYPGRLDFGDDPARIDKLQPSQRAVMEYTTEHNVEYISNRRNFALPSPEQGQAQKIFNELITAVATGKQDPIPALEEAEKLMQSAIEKDRP